MTRPNLFETIYANDRRAHRHRCQCCNRIVTAGEPVVMWKTDHKTSRVLHADCAEKPSFDGITQRQLAQLGSDEYARRLGFSR